MNFKEIFEVATAIITSLGGAGAVLLGLSSWFGKVWANRLLENEKAAHSVEVEEYKSQLTQEIDRLKAVNDRALYISKVQYDNEYRIYSEIWEKLHQATIFSEMLFPRGIESVPIDPEEKKKFLQEKYVKFVETYNEFSITIDKYAPFYKSEFYEAFKEIREICHSFGVDFDVYILNEVGEPMPNELRREVYRNRHDDLNKKKEELQNNIRAYLSKLRLGD